MGTKHALRPTPCAIPRLTAVLLRNGQSRIYLGIDWRFDKTEGIVQGRRVADYVFENAFQPVEHPSERATRRPLPWEPERRDAGGR